MTKLKSGTDIRGVATGENITLTDFAVERICAAFAKWLSLKKGKRRFTVAIGNDSRLSAARIFKAAEHAFLSSGCDVVYTGLSSTPSMFVLLKKRPEIDASCMITASHMPKDRNGLKFFTSDGGLDGKDIDDIIRIAENGDFLRGAGTTRNMNFMDEYSEILVGSVRARCGSEKPLDGRKIIVDAGNGAGGFFAEKVLKPLGADVSGSLYLEPDGNFPNHIPNPEDKGAIDGFAREVVKAGADLGVIFDTDVDRAGCVDCDGKELNKSALIALISSILLKEKPGVIVTDSVTSEGLTQFIQSLGGEHLRFKRGYKNVIDKCKELNSNGVYSPLAIETSGHAALKENYYLDDGAYLVTRILALFSRLEKGESICSEIAGLKTPAEENEIRISFSEKSRNFKREGAFVINELKKVASSRPDLRLAETNFEGARIYCDGLKGWFMLRQSVHDPVLPLNFESDEKGGNVKMARILFELLEKYEFLDLHNLKKFSIND